MTIETSYAQGPTMAQRMTRLRAGILAIALLLISASVANTLPQRVLADSGRPAGYIGKHHLRQAPSRPAFVFGNYGGLALSLTTTITNGGIVTERSPHVRRRFRVPLNTPRGLLKLAEALGFFSMAPFPSCSTQSPAPRGDTTTDFITIHTTTGVTRVDSLGGCNAAFAQLFDVLKAVARFSE